MFAETLAGIALVKSAVNGFKFAIGTARDISEIADDINKLSTGEQQIQKKTQKRSSNPFTVSLVARETTNAKLIAIVAEHRREIAPIGQLSKPCLNPWPWSEDNAPMFKLYGSSFVDAEPGYLGWLRDLSRIGSRGGAFVRGVGYSKLGR